MFPCMARAQVEDISVQSLWESRAVVGSRGVFNLSPWIKYLNQIIMCSCENCDPETRLQSPPPSLQRSATIYKRLSLLQCKYCMKQRWLSPSASCFSGNGAGQCQQSSELTGGQHRDGLFSWWLATGFWKHFFPLWLLISLTSQTISRQFGVNPWRAVRCFVFWQTNISFDHGPLHIHFPGSESHTSLSLQRFSLVCRQALLFP